MFLLVLTFDSKKHNFTLRLNDGLYLDLTFDLSAFAGLICSRLRLSADAILPWSAAFLRPPLQGSKLCTTAW